MTLISEVFSIIDRNLSVVGEQILISLEIHDSLFKINAGFQISFLSHPTTTAHVLNGCIPCRFESAEIASFTGALYSSYKSH